jgi:methylmalonyl-CoA mutase C-terminal domain/subunit
MDVIYTGLHRTPTEVVVAAVQEDVDVLGVSLLSGAHLTIIPVLIEELHRAEAGDILVVVGGVIPDEDVRVLLDLGVARVFSQDTQIDAIPNEIRDLVESRTSDL